MSRPAAPTSTPRKPRAKAEAAEAVCVYARCEKTITRGERAVRISSGYMHADCYKRHQSDVAAIIAAAVAEGRHSLAKPTGICSRCGRDVVIYSGAFQGPGRFCLGCWVRVAGLDDFADHQLQSFADGAEPNPLPDEPEFPARCFKVLQRRIAKRAAARRGAARVGF